MKRVMAGDRGQRRHQGEVDQVAQNDRQQAWRKLMSTEGLDTISGVGGCYLFTRGDGVVARA